MKYFLLFISTLFVFSASAQAQDENVYNLSISPTMGALDGGVYIGGQKIPASFYMLGVAIRDTKKSFYWGAEFNHLYNKSMVKNYGALVLVGKNWQPEDQPYFYGIEGGLGWAKYEEKTSIQQVAADGLGMLLRARVGKKLNEKWTISGSYNWIHYSYADSFWGSNILNDVVIDQKGLSLSIEYNF